MVGLGFSGGEEISPKRQLEHSSKGAPVGGGRREEEMGKVLVQRQRERESGEGKSCFC